MNERTILIVDDDLEDIEIFTEAVREIAPEICCISARNGEEGLRLIEDGIHKPGYVFFDLHMPRFNETKFIATVRRRFSCEDMKLFIYTGAMETERMHTLVAGTDGVIIKPSSFAELCDIVAGIVKAPSATTSQVA